MVLVEDVPVSEALHELAALPLYVVGWLAGVAARFLAWCRDVLIAGYRDGRGMSG